MAQGMKRVQVYRVKTTAEINRDGRTEEIKRDICVIANSYGDAQDMGSNILLNELTLEERATAKITYSDATSEGVMWGGGE